MKYILSLMLSMFLISNTFSAENDRAVSIINLADSIARSDLVVVGEIIGITADGPFFGYNKDGSLGTEEEQSEEGLGLPMIDYSVSVLDVLYDPDSIYEKGEIILRMLGNKSGPNFQTYYEKLKGKSVFFLALNPDNKTFGITRFEHFIHIDNEVTHYHSYRGKGAFVVNENGRITAEISPDDLLDKVDAALLNID